jgi:hypothetical protein
MKHYVAPGKTLPAMAVTDTLAVGMATLNQLEHFGIKSPWHMAKTAAGKLDPTEHPFKQLREVVQRTWDKPRSKRADLYSTYIDNVLQGSVLGGTPPVTLFVNKSGTQDGSDISFPYTSSAIAIDGETQLEARFRLRATQPDTGDIAFPVTIYHGVSEEQAMQILHDFNHFAKPISEGKLGVRNSAGGMSQTIEEAVQMVPGTSLNKSGALGTKTLTAGFQQAMFFVAGFAVGLPALDKSASGWFGELNTPGVPPVNGKAPVMLGEMFDLALHDAARRTMPTYLWQVAGVLGHEGRSPKSLNWDAGMAAYKAASANVGPGTGRGGNKGKTKDRLHAIYAALKA